MRTLLLSALGLSLLLQVGCTTSQPKNTENICEIFREKGGWYDDANDSRKEFFVPISSMMAIMHQESRFKAKARPPRSKLFGFIPWTRPSSAYGYSQAKDSTWDGYQRSSGNYGADRDDFGDAIHFVGWYGHQSYKRCGIKKNDTYNLYLAYHEGHGGFNRRSYNAKPWLKSVASKVNSRAASYQRQLNSCEKELQKSWWQLW